MSMFTRKMKMLTAIVLDSRSETVVKKLLELGVMDFVTLGSVHKESAGKLIQRAASGDEAKMAELRGRVEIFFHQAEIELPSLSDSDVENLGGKPDLDDVACRLDKLSSSLLSFKDKQQISNQKLIIYDEMRSYADKKKLDFLSVHAGRIERADEASFSLRLSQAGGVYVKDKEDYILLSLKRDEGRISPVLDKFGWVESSDAALQKAALDLALRQVENLMAAEKANMEALDKEIKDRIREKEAELKAMFVSLRLSQLCLHMESYFSYTDHTTLFSGWVPSDSSESVEKAIREATGNVCIIEWTEDTEVPREEVPVEIRSPRYLKPFEKIVNNYKTPEYGSINPIPFTAVAYMIMFALMFADFGQGFVLLLIGLLGTRYYKKNPMAKDSLFSRQLCSLLVYLGPASMAGGLLFGSCFGYSFIPAIWFNYHKVVMGTASGGMVNDIFDILGITIKFGIAVIYTGLLLNWINLIRKKRYLELIFDKNGLVGGTLYGTGIFIGFGFVASGYKTLPLNQTVKVLLILCLAMLAIKGPVYTIYNRLQGKEREKVSQVIIDSVMDFLLDCLEIFSGFLSNTLSFMRIAGLGIAHVSLMVAFEDMAAMTGNIIAEIPIMIVGNVLVLALEGLSAGIQALRLNYYEFFTKYFTGRGVAYTPVGINSRIQIDNK